MFQAGTPFALVVCAECTHITLWYYALDVFALPLVSRWFEVGAHPMHHKNILLISRTTRHHERMRALSRSLDVSIALAYPETFAQAISSGPRV